MSVAPPVLAAPDVVEGFRRTARLHPARPALVHNGTVVDYRTLEALVAGVADRLGPRPGTVAVAARRTPHTVVALLGVLAAYGTYCPVDPACPPARRDALLRAAGARALVDGTEVSTLDLDPPVTLDPEEPAYILFTSGSTGAAKPVRTPRRAIAAAVRSLGALLGLTADDRVLQFASLNWDTCFEEILPALTTGAALVIDDAAHTGSYHRFLETVERQAITLLDLPTAYWHELVHHLVRENRPLPPSLRTVVIGGEAAHPARLADWCALDTASVRLVNTYGCTETTLVTHAVDLHGPFAGGSGAYAEGPVPIGRALPHVVERVARDGELLIGGDCVALGYRGLPAATAEKFPVLGTERGAVRFFRTGDLVRRLDTGVLVHAGRVDHQVKVSGIRVDPGEAEAQLCAHPGVAAAAVTGRVRDGLTSLAAYVVAAPGAGDPGLPADVLAFLRPRSPRHLVPAEVVVVPELPLTPSGKVDRGALAALA
ncbi:Plipastatin synthase subunit E [Streptomyces sp. RB5]|uniref:Plipastatin synthase subunit E n=1 Tax=Streptomyces smaragdinus TaxID=2585196 RepID=A0A7K0CAF4_9ACTN|nr:AMP-binding protein [Streptomyces smaragdinus]MQY10373.1 Plipastatin synthase subunit E [Streptomyces smaragdinus]